MVVLGGGGIAPSVGDPPTWGWWWEYHRFSTQLISLLPPCKRAHSAKRAEGWVFYQMYNSYKEMTDVAKTKPFRGQVL